MEINERALKLDFFKKLIDGLEPAFLTVLCVCSMLVNSVGLREVQIYIGFFTFSGRECDGKTNSPLVMSQRTLTHLQTGVHFTHVTRFEFNPFQSRTVEGCSYAASAFARSQSVNRGIKVK